MRPQLTFLLAVPFAVTAPLALAEDGDLSWSGSVTVGARYVDDKSDGSTRNGEYDRSKLDEYRSLGNNASLIGGFEFRMRGSQNYVNMFGENFGADNQYLDVRGGAYGVFKYRLYSDELRHNLGLGDGALTPFLGAGSTGLSATLPKPTVADWNRFEQSYTRRDKGGVFEWQSVSPWYFRADANEVKREGVNVFSSANGTSPGNGFTNLPVPIDYTTRNVSGEVGFSSGNAHVAVSLLHSTFDNGNEAVRWNNGFFANGLDTTFLPADNKLTRLAVNGNMRGLPLNSTISGRLVYSQLTSDVAIAQTMLATTAGAFSASNPSNSIFEGDIKRTNLSLSWTAHPTSAFDTRAYMDYAKEENNSTKVNFAPGTGLTGGTCTAVSCAPEQYHSKRTKVGAEGGYRITQTNRVSGGLEQSDTDRERIDFDKTKETKAFVQYKNTMLESLTGRVKYQYLRRKSDFNDTISLTSGNPIDFYVRRFDLANVNQNLLKLGLDATPARMLDLGFEAIYKHNDYKDTILGRTDDKRQELYASASYGSPDAVRFLVFADYEISRYDSSHRVGTGNPDPASPPQNFVGGAGGNSATYNWAARNEDKAWQLGFGMDWKATARLKFTGSLIYSKTEGSADFTVEPNVVGIITTNAGGATVAAPIPITNFDNTKRTTLNLRAVYAVDKNWDLTGGYAYEKYQYDDVGYTGSFYVTSATATAGVVTGQYSFQPYKANILYATAKYKF